MRSRVLAFVCLGLGAVALLRVGYQVRWNLRHTGDGILGYRPLELLFPAVFAILFIAAAVTLLRRPRR